MLRTVLLAIALSIGAVAAAPGAAADDSLCLAEETRVERQTIGPDGSCASPGSDHRIEDDSVRAYTVHHDPAFAFVAVSAGHGCTIGERDTGEYYRIHGVGGGVDFGLEGFGFGYVGVTWYAFEYDVAGHEHHECGTVVQAYPVVESVDLGCSAGNPPTDHPALP